MPYRRHGQVDLGMRGVQRELGAALLPEVQAVAAEFREFASWVIATGTLPMPEPWWSRAIAWCSRWLRRLRR